VLRVDPDTATTAFDMRIVDDEFREVIYAGAQGCSGSGCSGNSRSSP
jgi:hypothetical protein